MFTSSEQNMFTSLGQISSQDDWAYIFKSFGHICSQVQGNFFSQFRGKYEGVSKSLCINAISF